MTTLPAAGYFTNAARTNAEAKTAQDDLLEVTREQPGGSAEQSLTIASGAVTPAAQASRAIKLAGEGAADDILDNVALTNVPTGARVILRGNGTDEITLNHGAGGSGQMLLRDAVDYVLDTDAKRVELQVIGTDLVEIWRSHPKLAEPRALVPTTSGTTSEITNISQNTRRLRVYVKALSTSTPGTASVLLQLGDATSFKTTGYAGDASAGFECGAGSLDGSTRDAVFTIDLLDPANNRWVANGHVRADADGGAKFGAISLAGAITRARLIVSGENFDAGDWTLRAEE